ncbi:MAG: DUF4249 domain-containing protein [Bacteroidales bacterium]|jgi:hypothetical protein|nr:DUF4249 domain-containing protein [Bacteroidales bacterium]
MSKNNSKIVKSLLLIILNFSFFIFNSCTAPIDIETDDSLPVISIFGSFTDELKQQSVTVSVSSPYFDNQPNRALSGATVEVSTSNGDVFMLVEDPVNPGRYQTQNEVAGVPGTTYKLIVKADINNDGVQESYSVTSTMPTIMTVDSIRIKSVSAMGKQSYELSVYAQDPLTEDYYLGIYEINGLLMDKISKYSILNDEMFNGQYMNSWALGKFGTMDDDDDRMRLKSGDVVILHFSRIEKGYYYFIQQCRNGMNGESPFGGPASNIVTNISGGGVGYFTAYAVSKTTAVVE